NDHCYPPDLHPFPTRRSSDLNMGVALGDVSGGGLFDLYVTHLTEETNTLWKQGPRGLFRDQTAAAGLASPHWHGTGFGTVLGDLDRKSTRLNSSHVAISYAVF